MNTQANALREVCTLIAGVAFVCLMLGTPARAAEGPPDAWLTTKTKIAVLTTVGVHGTSIHVDTSNGKVTLYGTVNSPKDKEDAQKAAVSVEGVKEVRNLLQVVPSKQEKAVDAADSAIADNVEAALKNDALLVRSSIRLRSVNNGTVLLAGKAESLTAELRAIETAERVLGVQAVHSEIESPDSKADAETWRELSEKSDSKPSRLSDAYITAAAKTRLLTDGETPANDINVDTTNGVVTLFGYVPSEASKAKAQAEALKVSGVKRVNNELQVVPSAQRSQVGRRDSEIESTIEKALAKTSGLGDSDIKVEVRNGVARLSGTVATESDKTTATRTARGISGVRSVESDLQMRTD
jgi:hyperosmotically inducible periplasmic protein